MSINITLLQCPYGGRTGSVSYLPMWRHHVAGRLVHL